MGSGHYIQVRRKFLGMTLEDLAKITSIHESMLLRFEEKLPSSDHLLSAIEHALLLPIGTLRESAAAAAAARVPTAAEDITAMFERLTAPKRRKGPTRIIDDAAKRQILLQRYGLNGEDTTFHAIAEAWGTSKQHIQQMVKSVQKAAEAAG